MTCRSVPAPAYLPNTSLEQLFTAELLLASTLRLFAIPFRKPDQNCPNWRGGLNAAGLAPWAAMSFAGLFEIVVVATRRPLDVRCPHARVLGHDEGRLLQLVSLFQHGQPQDAKLILGDWLPPSPRRLAAPWAEGLALALTCGGLTIPRRRGEETASPSHLVKANPGLALVQ